MVELLEHANARVDLSDYDNWNGGTYSWTLYLAVPVALGARFEQAQLTQIEGVGRGSISGEEPSSRTR